MALESKERPRSHTVMRFNFIEFDANWVREGTVTYTAADKAQMIVVQDGAAGTMDTWWFKLNKGDVVMVSWDTTLVYIPAICVKREPGDKTQCSNG